MMFSHRFANPKAAFFILPLILAAIGVGCTGKPSQESKQPLADNRGDRQTETTTLHIAVIPVQSPAKQQEQLQFLADYLSKALNKKVEFQVTKDYETAVDLLVGKKVEAAYLGPLSYVNAREKNPEIQPIVAPINKNTGRPWYNSLIIANSAKRIETIKDLKGKRFGFVSPSSTSGYLVAMAHFKKIDIEPDRDFREVKYLGSHDKSIAALESGIVDAVSVDSDAYYPAKKAGQLNSPKYKIIWQSDPIPTAPIVISNQMSPQAVSDLKKALLNAPEGLLDVTAAESAGYTIVEDADYEPIRQIKKNLEEKPDRAK